MGVRPGIRGLRPAADSRGHTFARCFRSLWPRLCYACAIIRTEGRQGMPARASSIDRGRVAEAAAWACCAVLGALALWLFVRVAWSLVPRGVAAIGHATTRNGVSHE